MPKKHRKTKTVKTPNPRQETLRDLLLNNKQEVTRHLEEQLDHQLGTDLQERIDHVLDSGDQASLDIAEEMDLSLLELRNKTLKAINDALQRLQEGTYGFCTECGEEIPEKRLKVMPFTPFCIPCQGMKETLEKIEKEEDRFK